VGTHKDGRPLRTGRPRGRLAYPTWLAVSDDPEAEVSGRYWHKLRQQEPAGEVTDPEFQDRILNGLARSPLALYHEGGRSLNGSYGAVRLSEGK
jgi:hypothetical protein